jgi:predicted ester cyclase/ketosteroid isomerase-like protein
MKKILFISLLMALLFNNISAKEIKEPQQNTHNFYTAVDTDLSDPQKNAINKIKELYQLMDAGKVEKFDEYCAKDFQIVNPVLPTPGNLETFKQLQLGFRAAFPDMLHEVQEIYSNGKSVVSKGIFKGTNTGSMMGNPPTGNRVALSFMVLDIMDSKGKIKMRTVEFDNKAFEAQLMKGINPHAAAEANIRKAYASLERHDFDAFASVCANDFAEKSDKEPIVGVWNAIEYYKNFLNAFPDIKFTIESIVPAGNNTYYLKTVATGTNTGSFAGLPPTGKSVSIPDVDIITLNAEGKCTSHSSINHNGMITAIGYGSLANPSTAVVMETYENFGKGDVPAILLLCNDDVLFDIQDHVFDTKARQFNGKTGVASFFTELSTKFKYNKFQPTRFVADGDDVFVTVDVAYTHLPSGKNYSTTYTHQFKVVNGKISYFKGLDGYQQMQ